MTPSRRWSLAKAWLRQVDGGRSEPQSAEAGRSQHRHTRQEPWHLTKDDRCEGIEESERRSFVSILDASDSALHISNAIASEDDDVGQAPMKPCAASPPPLHAASNVVGEVFCAWSYI